MNIESKEYVCGCCGSKAVSKVKASGKVHYPRSWKPFNGVLTCAKCRHGGYHTITLSWPVKECVSTHNVPSNAVVVELQGKSGYTYDRKLDSNGAPPDSSPQLIPWVAKKLGVEPTKVRSARHGFDVVRFLEPYWLEAKQVADLTIVEFLRQEALPIQDGKFGPLDMNQVIVKLKAAFPHLPRHVVGTMVLRILSEYRKHRYDVLVRGDHSWPTYKYGYPILLSTGKWVAKPLSDGESAPRIEVILGKEEGSSRKGKGSAQRPYQHLDGFRAEARFSSWLYRIAMNQCLNWQKRKQRLERLHQEWSEHGQQSSGPDARHAEQVQEALMKLPPKQRAAVVLTTWDGLNHAEAAAVLGCSETTVSWRVFAARTKLKRLLKNLSQAKDPL